MNALAAAQARWDSACPADNSDREEAADNWSHNAAEQLVRGSDVVIRTRRQTKVISQEDFLEKVEALLNQRRIDVQDEEPFFARLVLAGIAGAPAKTFAQSLMGSTTPHEVALELVEPWFDLALEQMAEDWDA